MSTLHCEPLWFRHYQITPDLTGSIRGEERVALCATLRTQDTCMAMQCGDGSQNGNYPQSLSYLYLHLFFRWPSIEIQKNKINSMCPQIKSTHFFLG